MHKTTQKGFTWGKKRKGRRARSSHLEPLITRKLLNYISNRTNEIHVANESGPILDPVMWNIHLVMSTGLLPVPDLPGTIGTLNSIRDRCYFYSFNQAVES